MAQWLYLSCLVWWGGQVDSGEKPTEVLKAGPAWGLAAPSLPHSTLQSLAGSLLHHIKAPHQPSLQRGLPGPWCRGRSQKILSGCGVAVAGHSSPCASHAAQRMADGLLGFELAGPSLVLLRVDRNLHGSGTPRGWSASLNGAARASPWGAWESPPAWTVCTKFTQDKTRSLDDGV